jgi:hypothetical protein
MRSAHRRAAGAWKCGRGVDNARAAIEQFDPAEVAEDEREAGRRAILNFTRSVTRSRPGASSRCCTARRWGSGWCSRPDWARRLASRRRGPRLGSWGYPSNSVCQFERPAGASVDQLIEVMRGDKNVRGGRFGSRYQATLGRCIKRMGGLSRPRSDRPTTVLHRIDDASR